MAVGDIMESALVCFGQGQNQLNVIHFRISAQTGVGVTMAEYGDRINNLWGTQLRTMIANTVTFKGGKHRRVSPNPTAVTIRTTSAGVGSLTGDDLPPQICGLISLRSSVAPPRIRGRMYLPQATEGSNDTLGVPTAGYIALMTGMASLMTTPTVVTGAGGTATLISCLYHRKVPVASYDIDLTLIRTTWATQRRRSAINRADTPAI